MGIQELLETLPRDNLCFKIPDDSRGSEGRRGDEINVTAFTFYRNRIVGCSIVRVRGNRVVARGLAVMLSAHFMGSFPAQESERPRFNHQGGLIYCFNSG